MINLAGVIAESQRVFINSLVPQLDFAVRAARHQILIFVGIGEGSACLLVSCELYDVCLRRHVPNVHGASESPRVEPVLVVCKE
jgi:hypothetical protein